MQLLECCSPVTASLGTCITAPQTFPVEIDHAVPPADGERCLLGQHIHRCGAASEAGQDADLHRHSPAACLDQRRLIQILGESRQGIGVVLNHQIIDQISQRPELPVLEPVVVGKAEGAGGKADHGAPRSIRRGETAAQHPQQFSQTLAAPAHPEPIGDISWGILAGIRLVERGGGGVIPQLDRPGEMIIQLDPIDAATLHNLPDQTQKPFLNLGMGGIEPHPQILQRRAAQIGAVHRVQGTPIPSAQKPIGVIAGHLAVSRLHQPVLEPRDHLQPASVGAAGETADGIEIGSHRRQSRLQRGVAAAVERGAAAPDIGVERVETGLGQLLHGLIDATRVVIERTGTVGQPDADPRPLDRG